MKESKYWNYKTCSEQTGMPLGTLYALVSAGRIPHRRLARRHVLFPATEVVAWIESNPVQLENNVKIGQTKNMKHGGR